MALKHEGQRVGFFVDVHNMYHSAKRIHNARVNFDAILKTAAAGRMLGRARAYVVTSHSGDEEEQFFDTLAAQGYDVQVQDLRVFSGGAKKADWDVGMAVDIMRFASRLDVVVIVTGDGDFVPLIEYLQYQGIQVEAMAFRESSAQMLIERVDEFVDLSAEKRKYLLRIK